MSDIAQFAGVVFVAYIMCCLSLDIAHKLSIFSDVQGSHTVQQYLSFYLTNVWYTRNKCLWPWNLF